MKKNGTILNSNGLNRFLHKNFPNILLETRSKQFLETYLFVFFKNFIKDCCLITRHRKGKILKIRDLKLGLIKNSSNVNFFPYIFTNLIKKKKKFNKIAFGDYYKSF